MKTARFGILAIKFSETEEERTEVRLREAHREVNKLGQYLIVTAVLGIASNLGLLMGLRALNQDNQPKPPPNIQDRAAFEAGQAMAPFFDFMVVGLISFAVYGPVLIGGRKLQNGCGGTLVYVGAVMGMLPCSIAFLVGLPVGIWAMNVLSKPGIEEALRVGIPKRNDRYR